MAEHLDGEFLWVSSVWEDQTHWLKIYPGQCESLSSVWADQIHWPEWLNIHTGCESLSSVWADQIHWSEWLNTYPGCELLSSVRSDPLTWMAEHPSSWWVALQCLNRSLADSLTWKVEHPFSSWVAVQCLRRSDPLIWMAEHPSRLWVAVQCQIRSTDLNGWTPMQSVSCFSVWADQIHWPEWLNIHPVCESLSSVWADRIHWPELLNTHSIQCVSHSVVFEQIRFTDLNGWTPNPACELLSSVRSGPLTWMAEHTCSLWVTPVFNQIHWPDWLNIHPVGESFFSV